MSKAPGELEDYTGDGDWFKVATFGSSDGQYWDTSKISRHEVRASFRM